MGGNRLLIAFTVLAVLGAITVWQFNARENDDKGEQGVAVKLPAAASWDPSDPLNAVQ